MSLLTKFITLVTGETTTSQKPQAKRLEECRKSSPQHWQSGLNAVDIERANNATKPLERRLKWLVEPDAGDQHWKERATDDDIFNLEEIAPLHPLVAKAKDLVAQSRSGALAMQPSKLPALFMIGSTESKCPNCSTPFAVFPQRGRKCKQCGLKCFSRTRPIDGQKVLLKESELPALEAEWQKDYQIKQATPRPIDPVWQARIDLALKTEKHADPKVEAAAQWAFQETNRMITEGIAPRDAAEIVIEKFEGKFKDQVDIRLWQLRVRSM